VTTLARRLLAHPVVRLGWHVWSYALMIVVFHRLGMSSFVLAFIIGALLIGDLAAGLVRARSPLFRRGNPSTFVHNAP
jgi:hypothetical protein